MRGFVIAALACMAWSTASAEDSSCARVRSADMGWTDIALTTNTAAIVLKAMGYEMTNTLLGLNITYESLKNGQVDVFLGNWRPAQDIEFKQYYDEGWVEVLGTNLTGAKFTLAVPAALAEAGVRGFDDLARFADKFDRKIYGIEPGSNQPLLDMVAAGRHGLKGWEIVESSEQGMLAQLQRAIARDQWIVFLGWQPHPMNLNFKIAYLTGGDAEYGPDFGGSTVRTIARPGYAAACPNLARFFANLAFDIDAENAGMKLMLDDGQDAPTAAAALIKAHPEKLAAWLDGVTTRDGRPALAVVQAALAK
ncbi:MULTISPECIES: choline ABC transporter substrate-binding protein [unclassified Inquilinus]|uniref:choline ABC transporter substrate-binding protein n=1 Tax=unclassified Inquilinus TaxID=2645927 RepID=UPI003F9224CD